MSKDEFANTIPVIPPKVNKKRNPRAHNMGGSNEIFVPIIVVIHLKILIPVGIAIIMVAAVK